MDVKVAMAVAVARTGVLELEFELIGADRLTTDRAGRT